MRIGFYFLLLMTFMSNCIFAEVIDFNEVLPKEGTPEHFIYDYINALNDGNKEVIKVYFATSKASHHQRYLDKMIERIQSWDLKKKFVCKIKDKTSDNDVVIMVGSVYKESGKSKARTFSLKKINNKWYLN